MGAVNSTHELLDKPRQLRQRQSLRSSRRYKSDKGDRPRRMDRLRKSFRDSFRRKKEHVPESVKPHQWEADESAVRAGTCSFHVKYLGCVEVYESRGMQVCEEALRVLRNSRRRPVKATLYVSGDGLRVVDDETKGLLVDQTIEKVSFCAPDRTFDRGFSYICRDGTTRRWMCHGFFAIRESGERLSHAVGQAFAVCLEKKQKRDKECGVRMDFDQANNTFTRFGSFRQMPVTERIQDPQECKPADPPPLKSNVTNPYAIERPHASAQMLQRQGSFRGFQQLNQHSPFKRQLSLRLSDLPSTLERQQRSLSLESSDLHSENGTLPGGEETPEPPPRTQRNRLHSLPVAINMSPIPESSPMVERHDPLSVMCQEVTKGMNLLSGQVASEGEDSALGSSPVHSSGKSDLVSTVESTKLTNPWEGDAVGANLPSWVKNDNSTINSLNLFSASSSRAEEWLEQSLATKTEPMPPPIPPLPHRAPHLSHLRSQSLGSESVQPRQRITTEAESATDPFEDNWANIPPKTHGTTNPFIQNNTVKAFEVKM